MTAPSPPTLTFFDILGGRFTLAPEEFVGLLRSKTTQTYLVAVYVLLLATDSPAILGRIHILLVLAVWCVVMGTFLAAVWLTVSAMARLQRLTGARIWPGPLIVLSALTPAIIAGEGLFYLAAQEPLGLRIVPDVLFFWLIAEMFGLIYFRYVRAHVDLRGAVAEAIPLPAERSIVIGAEPVPLSRLRHIEAREHHMHVTLDGQTLTFRARLGDIVAQTGPQDGFQPHRSWWVASRSARALLHDGNRHVLELEDGTRVPVARSRLDDVRRHLGAGA
ncbi:LytTR family DNA-binding domain-containing protein [Maliponia aquimaris]|uniref:LytTr DNA-binding domain protein n=1 Tax=Maliponia aquimaris TaxID=1673631 RepID=A0A238K0P1_9RHOB|nr:LytTR family DNA-binding domain-containing protein [Maliponia aquimaris]SMX36323.1 LytTr DNA-binding domain protein [Maliponia aquimaris]